jgi:hypothetical protein
MSRRRAAFGPVALGDVRQMRTGLAQSSNVAFGRKDAVRADQALVQQSNMVEQHGWRHPIPLPNQIDLNPALRDGVLIRRPFVSRSARTSRNLVVP